MLPIPTKIKAVREDPNDPIVNCYSEDPITLARIFASRSTSTTPTPTTPKGKTPMMNMTGYDGNHSKVEKTPINGINASNDPVRLIEILERLDLVSPEMAKPLKTIAAHGGSVKEVFQVSVYKLDQKLRTTEASVEQRLAFKASLDRFGLLVVPR
jgi:hypothetical protein